MKDPVVMNPGPGPGPGPISYPPSRFECYYLPSAHNGSLLPTETNLAVTVTRMPYSTDTRQVQQSGSKHLPYAAFLHDLGQRQNNLSVPRSI